jgi:hypothetical protein
MNEYETDHELAALWHEIYANEGGDVDAALRIASAELAELLMFAHEWDCDAATCRNTAQDPIVAQRVACAA